MKDLEKCTLKVNIEISNVLTILYDINKDCILCDGYNNKCSGYFIIKEECIGI